MSDSGWLRGVAQHVTGHALYYGGVAVGSAAISWLGSVRGDWSLVTAVAVGVGVFWLGLISYRIWDFEYRADEARISLRFRPSPHPPEMIAHKNIGRWQTTPVLLRVLSKSDPNVATTIDFTLVLVTFKPWINVGTLHVRGIDMTLPEYQTIKCDSDALLLIFRTAHFPEGTIEIEIK